ncbi:uncharacterized protein LOC112498642 [Citrus sinensis]|uniref:uncharacterized protein LOC112097394 n=1 Tax=Citrus clementina TaxID=85681 RepID=UPI000CED5D33|nr:uncharacterized protein LOC112097394 [Citrus x clementina]XP_024955866.2 uncharacterized protein LOC112498642 [Citrus sinensis]
MVVQQVNGILPCAAAQEAQLHVLGTKAQTPKGLLGRWQSIPKQQGMVMQVVLPAQHLHSRHSSYGASLLLPRLTTLLLSSSTSITLYSVSPVGLSPSPVNDHGSSTALTCKLYVTSIYMYMYTQRERERERERDEHI